ncbi:predicted protein [Chaetoceros tenuissimus]|uniref:Uncharacterized protein n=1 Tax=Chaetoceros tenuissimus TaxID=426638 RepID=A0AAD3CFR9_9STRA|nr:predicted protein [Chaetoceros tenuissimus]
MHILFHSFSGFVTVALLVIVNFGIVVAEGETKLECKTNGVKDELFIMSIHTTSSDEDPPSWTLNNIDTESVVASSVDDGMQGIGLVQMCLPLNTCYELSFESKSWGWFKAIYNKEIVLEAAQGLDQRLAAKFGTCEMDVPTGSSSGNCNRKYDPVFCGQDDEIFSNQCMATTANTEFTDLTCCPYHPGCDDENVNPVTCTRVDQKGRECKYTNECKAKAAAFDRNWICKIDEENGVDSTPNTCPNETGICIEIYAPVECHSDEHTSCEYDNQCIAETNGFNKLQCCPLNKGICPAVVDPLVCSRADVIGGRECEYRNKCRAAALDKSWICKKDEDNDTGSKPSSCPKESGICIAVYDPVKCYFPDGTSCKYSNQCFANNSNFTELDCCPVTTDECTEEYDPVICYRNNQPDSTKCEYSNTCQAPSTDSNWTCEKDISVQVESETCPSPSLGKCTKIFRPVDCHVDVTATSSTTCRYDNICLAERASDSFNEKTCCRAVTNAGKCTSTNQAPVRCGGCEYNNICEAKSVGYGRKMCTNLNGCPLPKNPGRCINAKQRPVFGMMRGTKKCWYASKCLAKKAGFRKKDIQKILK